MKKYLLIATLAIFASCNYAYAQSNVNRIYRPCPATTTKAVVEIQVDGDINLAPCSGKEVQINGVATSNTITFTGSSRTNYFPWFTTNTNVGKSPFSWTGTDYTLNNTAENATFKFTLTPSAGGVGTATLGNTGSGNALWVSDLGSQTFSGTSEINIFAPTTVVGTGAEGNQLNVTNTVSTLGDFGNNANHTKLVVNDSTSTFAFSGGAGDVTGIFNLAGISDFNVQRTITATGTTGNQTINKPAGSVNFAAAATQVSVTNSIVTANSIIIITQNNINASPDSACIDFNVSAVTAGSFKIVTPVACNAETRVSFLVFN